MAYIVKYKDGSEERVVTTQTGIKYLIEKMLIIRYRRAKQVVKYKVSEGLNPSPPFSQ